MIPFADPVRDVASYRSALIDAAARVISSGPYILGDVVSGFEATMARRIGASGAVGVASGTDALVIGLLALGVQPGDEVITVSHTAGPTVAAIKMVGATPVLVDVEPDFYGLDPAALDGAIGPRTKAIIGVHLYGHPLAMDKIMSIAGRAGVPVLEDCAQAQEARIDDRSVGSFGDGAAFSFYPTKILGAIGDGGLFVSVKTETVAAARSLRMYGWSKEPQFADLANGRCSRLDPIQAAILTARLARLDGEVDRRRVIAKRYNDGFADLPLIAPRERAGCRHVYHLYVVRSDKRSALMAHMKSADIGVGLHYPFPVHKQPALVEGARMPSPLTVTEKIANEILSLPIYPSLTDGEVDQVIDAVRTFFGKA